MRLPAVLVAIPLMACAPGLMHRTPALLDPPPAGGQARVVFMASEHAFGKHAGGYPAHIVDERGRLLGDLLPGQAFAADLVPGDRLFYAWRDDGAKVPSLRLACRGGAVTYVALSHEEVPWWHTARVAMVLVPSERPEPRLDDVAVDPRRAAAWSRDHRGEIADRLARADTRPR